MPDVVDARTRSRMMSGIRGKNTNPEIVVRSGLHLRGFRFRLHQKNLPGTPDLVLNRYKAVIFVHGCFWHMHGCHLFKWPSTRPDFWQTKLQRNAELDRIHIEQLLSTGWRVLTIWECGLKGKTRLAERDLLDRTEQWLRSDSTFAVIEGVSASVQTAGSMA
jgi:DNA mismatch endonuclease (patch repair protein)